MSMLDDIEVAWRRYRNGHVSELGPRRAARQLRKGSFEAGYRMAMDPGTLAKITASATHRCRAKHGEGQEIIEPCLECVTVVSR